MNGGPTTDTKPVTVGAIVKKLRTEAGLSKQALARHADVGECAIWRIERDQRVRPYVWDRLRALYCMRQLSRLVNEARLNPPWTQP